MLPENISIIAPIIATIGRIIRACAHCRPDASGTSGGASSISSPAGISGLGRRIGRRTTIVATTDLLIAGAFSHAGSDLIITRLNGVAGAMAGTCRHDVGWRPAA
jgi:hypothetical protein